MTATGERRRFGWPAPAIVGSLVIGAFVIGALVIGALGGYSTARTVSAVSPERASPLPGSNSPQTDRALTGTTVRPALTVEGDAVVVRLPAGSVRATVVGPEVPGQGLPRPSETTPCTWTITLEGSAAAAAFSLADFTVVDHFGSTYHPVLLDSPAPVPSVNSVGPHTFLIRATIRTGEGIVRWSPGRAGTVASWDFVAEND